MLDEPSIHQDTQQEEAEDGDMFSSICTYMNSTMKEVGEASIDVGCPEDGHVENSGDEDSTLASLVRKVSATALELSPSNILRSILSDDNANNSLADNKANNSNSNGEEVGKESLVESIVRTSQTVFTFDTQQSEGQLPAESTNRTETKSDESHIRSDISSELLESQRSQSPQARRRVLRNLIRSAGKSESFLSQTKDTESDFMSPSEEQHNQEEKKQVIGDESIVASFVRSVSTVDLFGSQPNASTQGKASKAPLVADNTPSSNVGTVRESSSRLNQDEGGSNNFSHSMSLNRFYRYQPMRRQVPESFLDFSFSRNIICCWLCGAGCFLVFGL